MSMPDLFISIVFAANYNLKFLHGSRSILPGSFEHLLQKKFVFVHVIFMNLSDILIIDLAYTVLS